MHLRTAAPGLVSAQCRRSIGRVSRAPLPHTILRAALCCGALLSATAAGQDAGDAPQPAPVGDEVIVTGKSPGQLRLEMERAEEDVYDRLNRLNTDHRLDIHCHREAPINSHILRRACQPNYYRDAEAKAAQQELLGLQVGGGAIDTSMYYSEAAAYREALRAQMRRAANEDEQFQRALVRDRKSTRLNSSHT